MADAASPNVSIFLGEGDKGEVPDGHVLSCTVDRDMNSPDIASILLANQSDLYSPQKLATPVQIKVGDGDGKSIFIGEIVGLEPIYKGGDKSKILIRAMNRFHRLLRVRKSVTFTDKTDEQILKEVVGEAGLKLEWEHETSISYKHVYRHNQTGMEFLRTRAARMGCHVWSVDKTVFVKQPKLQGSGTPLNVDQSADKGTVRMFAPRLSYQNIVKKVTVKGWNPETKELISGDASVSNSQLGKETGVAGVGELAGEESFTVDHPIWDKAEATALAKARLQDASLSYITGICEVAGSPEFDLGKLVTITANAKDEGNDPFNGTYYTMGVTHRLNNSHAKDDSAFVTVLRLARDAQGKK